MRKRTSSAQVTTNTTMEIEVEVTGTAVPFVRGVMTLSNGDPGYPDEGGYAEDITVYLVRKDKEGKEHRLDITDFLPASEVAGLSDLIMEQAVSDDEAAYEDACEARAERRLYHDE